MFVSLVVLISIVLLIVHQHEALFVADSRIQNPNLTPALGRGYSTSSSSVLSTCLAFKDKTEPTYNYDYDFMEISSSESSSTKASASFEASLSWKFITASVSVNANSESKKQKKSTHLVAKMSMERYYSSIDDTTATLTVDAMKLLQDKNDVVGFYQSCGSGYIRSIRRTAEVTAVFTYESSSESSLKSLASDLKLQLSGRAKVNGGFSGSSESASSDSSLHISIKAFGLGLNLNGSDTLVARTIEDYHKTLDFAFKSMMNDNVGMIRGVEIVPWVDNLQFQNAINLRAIEQILMPEDVQAIEKKREKTLLTLTLPGTSEEDKEANKKTIDLYYDRQLNHIIESVELKSITTTNAEFIAEMDKWYRKESYLVLLMRNCMGELSLLNQVESLRGRFLINHKEMEFGTRRGGITVGDLSEYLSGARLIQKFESFKGFVSGYFGPCTTGIQRYSNNGRMTRYFWDISECKDLSCLGPNKEYNVSAMGVLTCSNLAVSAESSELAKFSLDEVLEKYCLPDINYALDPIPWPRSANSAVPASATN